MQLNSAASKIAQTRPGDTNAATAFTASVNTEITNIVVCNVDSSARTFRVFHGASGDSFDEDTALFWDVPIAVGETVEIYNDGPNSGISMIAGDLLGVRSSAADALNFTVYGVTQNIAGVR